MRAWLSRTRMDVTPYRQSRDFRLLFLAGTVFYLGGMVTYVAVPYQLYDITGSNFVVGAVGLVELVPLIVFGLWGGALADHMDRRTLLVWTGVAQVVFTGVLVVNAFLSEPQVWVIFVVAGLLSAAQSLQRPSREALIPRTVAHDQLPAAVALSTAGVQVGMLAGPAVGGVLLHAVGTGWCFLVDVVGIAIATSLFFRMRAYPPVEDAAPPSLRGIGEGLTYAVGRRDLLGTYLIDIVAMFMAMPTVLFPAFAQDVLQRPEMLGLLYSAGTVGALIASLTSGWTGRMHHHGRAVVLAAMAWGASVAVAGLLYNPWLVLLCFTVAGAMDNISGIFRSIIWHQTIPDSMRGRLAGIEMLSYSIGPIGGEIRSGLVADRFGVRQAITTGGILCVLGVAATSLWLRGFWTYDDRTDQYAVHERKVRAERAELEG
ncbi:MAG: MFS transporter [Actinomycetales bacterium]